MSLDAHLDFHTLIHTPFVYYLLPCPKISANQIPVEGTLISLSSMTVSTCVNSDLMAGLLAHLPFCNCPALMWPKEISCIGVPIPAPDTWTQVLCKRAVQNVDICVETMNN